MIEIAPSLLAANGAKLGEEAEAMVAAGADRLHFDIMDQHYVPYLSYGPWLCQALRDEGITVPLDVHLMTSPVDGLIDAFAKAGATEIGFHPSATPDVGASLDRIHQHGCEAALVLNPDESIDLLLPHLSVCDHVLLMSVVPGRGGQSLIPEVLDKARDLRVLLDQQTRQITMGMDGGVNLANVSSVAATGVDRVIMGTALYGADDYTIAISKARGLLGKPA